MVASLPRVYHKPDNHLCEFHTCAICNPKFVAKIIGELEAYLAGYNSEA